MPTANYTVYTVTRTPCYNSTERVPITSVNCTDKWPWQLSHWSTSYHCVNSNKGKWLDRARTETLQLEPSSKLKFHLLNCIVYRKNIMEPVDDDNKQWEPITVEELQKRTIEICSHRFKCCPVAEDLSLRCSALLLPQSLLTFNDLDTWC